MINSLNVTIHSTHTLTTVIVIVYSVKFGCTQSLVARENNSNKDLPAIRVDYPLSTNDFK